MGDMDLGLTATPLRQPAASAAAGVAPGTFRWATIYQFPDKDGPKAACLSGQDIYSTSRKGVKWWSAKNGR